MLRVDVYKNLRQDCWSVRSREKGPNYGKVIARMQQLILCNVHFKVSEPGRQRVLKSRQKNVHAVARGEWYHDGGPIGYRAIPGVPNLNIFHRESGEGRERVQPNGGWKEIRYNPYQNSLFQMDGEDVHVAKAVVFTPQGETYIPNGGLFNADWR